VHFDGQIRIDRSIEQVWTFFENVENLPRWDRGVARVEWKSGDGGVGSTFDTIGHRERSRMSYRVTEAVSPRHYAVVTDSGYFSHAEWHFALAPATTGTEVTCSVDFALRTRYSLLAPVLKLFGGAGMRTDLDRLKLVVEADQPADLPPTG
jgi:carbon monoxide dehydrogenase subunit G